MAGAVLSAVANAWLVHLARLIWLKSLISKDLSVDMEWLEMPGHTSVGSQYLTRNRVVHKHQ